VGCGAAEGKQQGELCTEKRDVDGRWGGFARNREKCGADVTTSPIKDFGEGIKISTSSGGKVSFSINGLERTVMRASEPNAGADLAPCA
jgi:hypothetical protein